MDLSVSEGQVCGSCGSATTDGAKYCGNCGNIVNSSAIKSKSKLRVGLGVGALAVVIALAGGWAIERSSTPDSGEARTELPKTSVSSDSKVATACYFRADNDFSKNSYIEDGYAQLPASPVVLWKLLAPGHPDALCQLERIHPETIYISYSVAFGDYGLMARAISDGYLPGSNDVAGTFESPWYPIFEPGIVTMVVDQPHTDELVDARLEFQLVTIQIKDIDSINSLSDVFGK